MFKFYKIYSLPFIFLLFVSSCGDSDDSSPAPVNTNNCTGDSEKIFVESDSILLVEIESIPVDSGWILVRDISNATGTGYIQWDSENSFGSPGNGLLTYKLRINNPGTYRFNWRSAVKEGDNGTESNDSWLRFNDADDFYGERNNGSIVYPEGTGKTPNPNGASRDGWFKIYRSGSDLDFKWQARTSDNDAHDIYVVFETPGTYTMEVSGRSEGHAIDKFLLYQESAYSDDEAEMRDEVSQILCE